MSSGPNTALDAVTVADGYIDEAFAFDDEELNPAERWDLAIAHDYVRKVIDSMVARQS